MWPVRSVTGPSRPGPASPGDACSRATPGVTATRSSVLIFFAPSAGDISKRLSEIYLHVL